jgi:hypothetical protein
MGSKLTGSIRAGLAITALVWCAAAQDARLDARSNLHITLPEDSPVTVLQANWGESRASARGGAMVLELRTAMTLRNDSPRRIRGITLQVSAQEGTPGGKASVSVPSLDVGPGQVFPVRVELQLLRPLQADNGPLVEVTLDGVLFSDLSFYGPNRLNSRRDMMIWEMEARRDRQYFKSILQAQGPEGLRREMVASLARQDDHARGDVQMARAGRATAAEPGRPLQLAFLEFPESPLEVVSATTRVVGNEARAPRLEVRNRADRSIRHAEVGWIVKDQQGREFAAGRMPAELNLGPRQVGTLAAPPALKFSRRGGQAIEIEGMTGFLNSVEFSDGSVWIPGRGVFADPRWNRMMTVSPEEQRLAELYRKKGLNALVEELKKF